MTYQEFLEWEPELTESLKRGFLEVLHGMGEDIKGISWFSVVAPEYCAGKYGSNKIYPANFSTSIRNKQNTPEKKDGAGACPDMSARKAA